MAYRLHLIVGAGLVAVTPIITAPTAAYAQAHGEIGYPQGSLGYDALVAGNLSAAEAQIDEQQTIASGDPARLINLGYIYMRTGRLQQARVMFETVRDARDAVELELANGDVIDSRMLARRALARLSPALAQR